MQGWTEHFTWADTETVLQIYETHFFTLRQNTVFLMRTQALGAVTQSIAIDRRENTGPAKISLTPHLKTGAIMNSMTKVRSNVFLQRREFL